MAEEPKKPEDEAPAEPVAETPPPAEEPATPRTFESEAAEVPLPETEPVAPQPQRSGGGWGRAFAAAAVLVLLAVAGVAVAGYLTYPVWKAQAIAAVRQGLQADPASSEIFAAPRGVAELREAAARLREELTRLRDDIGRKDQEIAAMRDQAAALDRAFAQVRESAAAAGRTISAEPALVEELNRRIGRIEATLDADRAAAREAIARVNEEQARTGAAVQSVSAAVKGIAGALQKRTDADARSRLLVIALSQLSAALSGAEPFEPLLTSLRAVEGENGALTEATETLRPYARKGIPTRTQLRDRFEATARAAVQAEAAPQGGGWWDRTLARLTDLVSVRTVGKGAEPRNPVDAAVAAAERNLGEGNLGGAVDALAGLQGAPAKAVEGWLAAARARLVAERAVAAINERAKTALAEAGG